MSTTGERRAEIPIEDLPIDLGNPALLGPLIRHVVTTRVTSNTSTSCWAVAVGYQVYETPPTAAFSSRPDRA